MRIDIAITHDNGMRTSHQYTVPNDNNINLVCTNLNSNERIVYPLVQVQSRPIIGQSSQIINPHFRRPGAGPGAAICSEYMAKRLRDQTSGFVSEPNILISHNSSYFSVPNITPSCFDPSILLNSFNLSNGNNAQVVKGSVSTEESGGRVVVPEKQNPKRGPYTCKRCGDVFDICQAFAAHMNTHYRAEETPEERLARQAASKYKRKRANNDLRLELTSSNIVVPAAPDLYRENGENSNSKSGHDDHLMLEFSSSSMIVPEPSHGVMDAAAPDSCKESGDHSCGKKGHDLE